MKRLFALMILTLPFQALAENTHCQAMFLDLNADNPVPGFITALAMTDESITLTTKENKELVYQIDPTASSEKERTYTAKMGRLPIGETPVDQQVGVVFMTAPEDKKDFDGVLTDSRLDTYVLLNCKTMEPLLL